MKLQPLQRVTNGAMTGTDVITSGVIDGRYLTNIKWQIVWTGTPTGTFSLQESLNYSPVSGGGDWLDNGAGITGPSGAANSVLVNLQDRGPCFYRLVYTNASGTGTLNVWASGASA